MIKRGMTLPGITCSVCRAAVLLRTPVMFREYQPLCFSMQLSQFNEYLPSIPCGMVCCDVPKAGHFLEGLFIFKESVCGWTIN